MIYEKFEEKRKEIQSTIISRSEYFNKRFNEIEFSGKLSDISNFKESKKEEIHLEYKDYQVSNSLLLSNLDEQFRNALFDEYGVELTNVNLVVFQSLDKGSYYEKECEFIEKIELAEAVIGAMK